MICSPQDLGLEIQTKALPQIFQAEPGLQDLLLLLNCVGWISEIWSFLISQILKIVFTFMFCPKIHFTDWPLSEIPHGPRDVQKPPGTFPNPSPSSGFLNRADFLPNLLLPRCYIPASAPLLWEPNTTDAPPASSAAGSARARQLLPPVFRNIFWAGSLIWKAILMLIYNYDKSCVLGFVCLFITVCLSVYECFFVRLFGPDSASSLFPAKTTRNFSRPNQINSNILDSAAAALLHR